MTIERAEPPLAAGEVDTLRGFLDYYRATLRRQVEGLDADELTATLGPSTMTLGGMVKHLAYVEHWWFQMVLHGREPGGIWMDADWDDDDWDWHSALHHSGVELDALLAGEIAAADEAIDEALADGGLDRLALRERRGGQVNLRWILVHMIEEYARHCGHADLIREAVDGARDL